MEQYSNSATRQVLNQGSRFAGWMGESVGAFITDLAESRADAARWRSLLAVDTDRADLFARRRGKLVHLATYPNDAAKTAAAARKKLNKADRQGLVVMLCGRRAIVKPVTLPAGALNVAAAIVRNKIESLAPWPVEDAVWGYRIAGEPEGGQFTLDVGITGRKGLDALLAALSGAGLRVARLEIGVSAEDENPIAVDFQSDVRQRKARGAVRAVMGGVGFFALMIAAYGAWQAIASQSKLSAIDSRTAALTASLRAQPTAVESGKALEAAKAVERKRNEPPVLVVLNGVTAGVPDDAWLNTLDYADGKLTMAGRGLSIPGIIQSLEDSEMFSDVNFAAPTQRDPDSEADMFSISASIEKKDEAAQ